MFDQQIRPFFKRFEPQVDRLKLKANEVVTKGNVLSQNCLVKARVLQVQAVDSFKNSSLLNKEAMLQLAKEKSSTITDLAVKKSSAALYKSEEFIFGTLRNNLLVVRALFREISRQQDFTPPSIELWASAKSTYEALFRQAMATNPLDYTWKQIGLGMRRLLEILAFFYAGKFIGTSVRNSQ